VHEAELISFLDSCFKCTLFKYIVANQFQIVSEMFRPISLYIKDRNVLRRKMKSDNVDVRALSAILQLAHKIK